MIYYKTRRLVTKNLNTSNGVASFHVFVNNKNLHNKERSCLSFTTCWLTSKKNYLFVKITTRLQQMLRCLCFLVLEELQLQMFWFDCLLSLSFRKWARKQKLRWHFTLATVFLFLRLWIQECWYFYQTLILSLKDLNYLEGLNFQIWIPIGIWSLVILWFKQWFLMLLLHWLLS